MKKLVQLSFVVLVVLCSLSVGNTLKAQSNENPWMNYIKTGDESIELPDYMNRSLRELADLYNEAHNTSLTTDEIKPKCIANVANRNDWLTVVDHFRGVSDKSAHAAERLTHVMNIYLE